MKRLVAGASLLALLSGCNGAEIRRIRCWEKADFPPTKQQVQNVTGWPEDGYVFSTKTGQLYSWDSFQERYLPNTAWESVIVGDNLKIRPRSRWFPEDKQVNLKNLTAQTRVGANPVKDLKCLELPIKHPVGKPGS